MKRPRLSIARLMVVVGLLAVGFAALRSPSRLWASALFSLALAAFTVGALAAVYRRGERRAFWVGFVSCGGVSLLLALGLGDGSPAGPHLLTTAILEILYPHVVPPEVPLVPDAVYRPTWAGHWTEPERRPASDYLFGNITLVCPEPFRRIGHSLFSLLFALLGGSLARHFASTRDRPEPGAP